MERFLRPVGGNKSKQGNVSAAERAKSFADFHEDGGKLFCTPCNKVIDHVRKSTVDGHLSSQGHLKRKTDYEADSSKRQKTITTTIDKQTIGAKERAEVTFLGCLAVPYSNVAFFY